MLSGTVKASQREGSFSVNSRFIVLYSATKVYGVFSSSVLVYSYGRQPKTVPEAHAVLETCGTFLREPIRSWH